MRKFIFIFITLTYTYTANAQVLDSLTLPVFSDTSSILNHAKGWLLQNDGEWASSNNTIPHDKTVIHEKSSEYKLGKDNFTSIELTPFTFYNKSYILMVVKFTEGYYEFPNLKSNWKTNKAAYFYVFEKDKLRHLIPDESMLGKPFSVNLNVYCSGIINLETNKLGIKNIVSESIIKTKQQISKNYVNLIFSLYLIKNEDSEKLRFKLIRTYTNKALYEYYLQASVQQQIFSKFYYETDSEEFNEFITKCLKSTETFKKQIHKFSNDTIPNEEEYESNYNEVKNQMNSFKKNYEDLKIDTSNFYGPLKISKFADTVAATSYVKPNRGNKKDDEKINTKITIIKSNAEKTDTVSLSSNQNQYTHYQSIDTSISKQLITDSISHNNQSLSADSQLITENNIHSTKIILRIQIASATDNLSEELYRQKFGITEKIYIIQNGDLYKYAVGEFYNFEEAIKYKQQIIKDFGVNGAFIIAIQNDKLISIQDARKLLN